MIDFIGIGGQRSGTTWIHANLSRHPSVRFPAGKEVHYWNRRASEGPAPWLAMFPDAPPGVVQGEITPAYAILPVGVIGQIHAAAPDAKLFMSVRNPLRRAWSAVLFFRRGSQMDPGEASEAWMIDVARSRQCRAKSTYSASIEAWRSVVGPDALELVCYDDIEAAPAAVLRQLARHLGVDPAFYPDGDPASSVRQGIRSPVGELPPPAVLEVLRELHADEIGRLEPLLDRDLGHWSRWPEG